CMQGRQLPLTF
nr:immunoglobulin light chain junction region [Macaca mulatta]MOW13407.1 immunoglobulin light chain junction region [Macaca mulatta]